MSCTIQLCTLDFWHIVLGFNIATAVTFWKLFTTFFSVPQAHVGWSPTCYGPYLVQLKEVHPSTIPYGCQESCLLSPTSVCWPSPWHRQRHLTFQTTKDRPCPSGGWARKKAAAGRMLRASFCCLIPQGPEWAGTLLWAHGSLTALGDQLLSKGTSDSVVWYLAHSLQAWPALVAYTLEHTTSH